ncbi:hypothetical protein NLK61_08605 [Pseudomonas fuscovaginae UPB0736]|nr:MULTISPECIES: hypothetical protein [Pseudomonas]UUQ66687.1 hypothetical protein NLK61_08605 [Pseudomonas fuscovaginae UPB0736]
MMSLQVIWGAFAGHPGKWLNLFALLVACPGAWLLQLTRRREQRALEQLETQSEGRSIDQPLLLLDSRVQRANRFFYRFGFACLAVALLMSWISTRF